MMIKPCISLLIGTLISLQAFCQPGRSENPLLLPVPQQSSFTGTPVVIGTGWVIVADGVRTDDPAVKSLQDQLKTDLRLMIPVAFGRSKRPFISLRITEGAVEIGKTVDTNRTALSRQAYHLSLKRDSISILANAAPGLYYGVQTLVQLLHRYGEEVGFTPGEITDWPQMNLRMIYWDDAHHMEKTEVLRQEILQASRYKINGFAIKLEGHFQYTSAKPIVEPHALSAKEFQALTDYAAAHYVQLIPYLDAPAHVSFILKHPEYQALRAFPNSNYQFTVNNPKTYALVSAMFKELIDANKGVDYVVLSNDEAYYTGKAANEIDSAKALGGNGKLLAQFISRMADTLKKFGRKPIFWGEYPLTVADIKKLPTNLIDGVYDSSWAADFKARGIRQMLYVPIQGEEPLFPNYYPLNPGEVLHPGNGKLNARVPDVLKTITGAISDQRADLAGVIVAGWADAGLHPGTFWLGYATGGAIGWKADGVSATELSDRFYSTYYRGNVETPSNIYRLISRQAQFYEDSWEWGPSNLRKSIFGNHAEIYKEQKPALDQFLSLPAVPSAKTLVLSFNWADSNARRLELARMFLRENDSLMQLLNRARTSDAHLHNLDVVFSVAGICRQNLTMLLALGQINAWMISAATIAENGPAAAIGLLDSCLDKTRMMLNTRNAALGQAIRVWYQDWLPLVPEANGRKYLYAVDDVKDHRPVRTPDLSYLIYRELHYPIEKWTRDLLAARNGFAVQHHLNARTFELDWSKVPH